MNTDDLKWFPVGKGDLPEIILGIRAPIQSGFPSVSKALANGNGVVVGYSENGLDPYFSPAAVVLKNSELNDTFAWLKVYAPDSFPLSQFARVLTDEDWQVCNGNVPLNTGHSETWGCVILGEMLAYGASGAELRLTPLSRYLACYSNVVAKCKALYGDPKVLRDCTDRLRILEKDSQFLRRDVSVRDLVPIWSIAASGVTFRSENAEAVEVVRLVLSAVASTDGVGYGAPGLTVNLEDLPDLVGESIEKRVLAFQELVARVNAQRYSDSSDLSVWNSAIVAAGAYLVGRGTSHAFLLRRYASHGSAPLLWFALFAGIHGPKGWDSAWARLAKGVERQIRTRFTWSEPSSADISWSEYAWTTRASSGRTSFAELARLNTQTLTIEIVPGVSCQLRLTGETQASGKGPSVAPTSVEAIESDQKLRAILGKFVDLARDVQVVLGNANVPQTSRQEAIPFGGQKGVAKRARNKSASRNPSAPSPSSEKSKDPTR